MSDDRHADLFAVADTFIALLGTVSKGRAALIQAAEDDVEWLGNLILHTLKGLGPVRASSVAESLHLDKSSVSRQVAALTHSGLVERRDDPADGRASILVLSDQGMSVVADLERRRMEFFEQMLVNWSDGDVACFEQLLARFADDFSEAHSRWMAQRQPEHGGHDPRHIQGAAR